MKTYILMISESFPSYHERYGDPTCFIESIGDGSKIHTIRNNFYLWERRVNEVQSGRAIISLRKWKGKPYRSKQFEIMQLTQDDKIGVESLVLSKDIICGKVGELEDLVPTSLIAHNDGLLRVDFEEWFKHYTGDHLLAIIHFTSFRYSNVSI